MKKFTLATIIAIVVGFISYWAFYFEGVYNANNSIYPEPTEVVYVHDYCSVLTNDTEEYIAQVGEWLDEQTTAQVVTLITPDTGKYDLETYTNKLANKWGVGDADKDNGIVILFTLEPHVRLEVGKGLEGCINDGKAGRILDDNAVAPMEQGEWNKAVINTYNETVKLICTEYGIAFPTILQECSMEPLLDKNRTIADAEFIGLVLTEEQKLEQEADIKTKALGSALSMVIFALILILVTTKTDSSGRLIFTGGGSSSGGGGFGGGSFGGGGASR